jgi:aerobic-type carbon monoxide dehydrogenase small subunit (CoxS/CutS family)
MIVAALGLLKKNPDPSEAEIRSGLRGNLCRCGTYPRIVQAVKKAAAAMRAGARP